MYAYAGSSPLMKTDRSGLDVAVVVGGQLATRQGVFLKLEIRSDTLQSE